MATTTPNFGWSVPTSSDLVKNGATAIETLGDGIDATLVDLKGGTTGQVLSKTSATDMDFTWATPSSSTSGDYAAGKNKIINGNFGIWQRGTSSSGNAYLADRWYSALISGTGTFAQESTTLPTGANYAQKFTASATAQPALYQAIETANARSLANQSVTVSAQVAASTSVGMTIDVQYSTSVDVGVTGTWTSISATSGGTATPTSTTYVAISGVYAIPSTAKSLRVRLFTTSTIATSVVVYFANVQIEVGSTATPFQTASGSIGGELALCQRYYYRLLTPSGSSGSIISGFGVASSTTNVYLPVQLATTMRINPPTVDYATIRVSDWTGGVQNITSLSIYDSTTTMAILQAGVASGLTQYRSYSILSQSAYSGYIGISAEL